MKRKLLVLIMALAMIMSLIPATVQAAGTGDGSSAENAFVVTDSSSLQVELSDPAVSFIETSGYIDYVGSVSIPTGKTLIVQPALDMDYAFLIGEGGTFSIEAGGAVINNGGIKYTSDLRMRIEGSLINNAGISEVCIAIGAAGTLTNNVGALIDERSAILFYSGSLLNSGTISCLTYQIGPDTDCIFSGIDASMIRQTNEPVDYRNMPFKILSLPENDTTTVGMAGDDSTLIFAPDNAPDNYLIFAKGYKVDLEAGQTIVVQQSSDFCPYMYLVSSDESSGTSSSLGGLRYMASLAETVTIVAGGYDTLYVGSLKVTVYDPEENTDGGLDFTDPSISASGEGWAWDSASKTLSLSGVMLSAAKSNGITLPDGSTIVLSEGTENFIQSSGKGGPVRAVMAVSPDYGSGGIYGSGDLTITGSGNLTVNGHIRGVSCDGILTINGQGALYFSGGDDEGIFAEKGIVIKDCSDLTAFGDFSGIGSGGIIQIIDSYVVAYGWNYGIATGPFFLRESENIGGNIEITNSQIDASCSTGPDSMAAIYAGDNNYDADSGVHSKIIINNGGILLPGSGYICDVAGINDPRCQTITSIEGLAQVTMWEQAAKSLMLMPAASLTYNKNGGSGTMQDTVSPYLRSDEVTTLANQFTRTGYTFTGWNTAADDSGTSYATGATFAINNNTTLFAMWEINTFTVTFADWNGTVLSTLTVDYGDPAMAPAMPSRTGYQFDAWDSDFSVISADRTITALYSLIPTTTPTTTPTATPAATPTPTSTPAVLAAVKTGETGSVGTAAAIFTISAIGIFAVQFVLRRKAQK